MNDLYLTTIFASLFTFIYLFLSIRVGYFRGSPVIRLILKMDDETNYREPVNVTPNPDKQDNPLSKLKEVMGMDDAEVEQAKEEVLNNLSKEE